MLKKINCILSNNHGNGLISLLWLSIIIFLLASVGYEYMRLHIISSGVKDALQNAIIAVATENYDNTQYALQDSYVGAYSNEGVLQLDKGDIMAEMDELLGLNDNHIATSFDSEMEFQLSNLEVDIKQANYNPAQSGDGPGKYVVDGTITIVVPLNFGWDLLPPVKMNLKTSAGWGSKY